MKMATVCAVTCLIFSAFAAQATIGATKMLSHLDADQNGLYDDGERKALLDVLQQKCPTLQGTFDADGDGKVTVLEQSQGRHPISMVIPPERITESDEKIPWAIDLFPEWITTAYFQEDVSQGAIAEHPARGTMNAPSTQPAAELQPRKTESRGGVQFAENSGQYFTRPGQREARWDYRWCVFTFRIDGNTGAANQTVLLDLNQGNASNRSSPKIWYNKQTGLSVQYVGRNVGGLDRRVMTTDKVVADGKTWNVVVCGIRYGQMFASVNGVSLSTETKQPPRFSGDWIQEKDVNTYIGDTKKGNMAWAYDAVVFGLTEPSEAMVRKMTGWAAHRLGFQNNLPADHPYRTERPVLDAEDFPTRYVHDNEKWEAWGASATNKSVTRINAGGPRVEPKGFERVFHDDFRVNRAKASTSGEGDLWVGGGFNSAVGGSAPLVEPGRKPDAYPYDAEKHQQTLSLVPDGKGGWRGSALYTVNDLGHGYTWKGPKVFRIRCMFPKVSQDKLPGGLFPAFWSYGVDNIFWRTANRIEIDYFEFDGQNGQYLNGLSTHYHYAYFRKNIFAKNPESYKRFKVYGGELTEEKSKIPGGLFIWDGQFHTWEFVIDDDTTYINVTIPDKDGKDKWVEVARCPTPELYLERLDLQLDYALIGKRGAPPEYAHLVATAGELPPGIRQDFVIDWIEVLQKSHALQSVPKPFTAAPAISGAVTVGSTIACEPNLDGVTDVRYYWFADNYPLTYGPDRTYTVTAADAGKTIRCMVKAVGARDMPEAWSNTVK